MQLPGPPRAPYALAVADLNRDDRPDIVVGHVESPGSVYFNTGQGRTFYKIPWNDGKGGVYGMAFADFDGDGWLDTRNPRAVDLRDGPEKPGEGSLRVSRLLRLVAPFQEKDCPMEHEVAFVAGKTASGDCEL